MAPFRSEKLLLLILSNSLSPLSKTTCTDAFEQPFSSSQNSSFSIPSNSPSHALKTLYFNSFKQPFSRSLSKLFFFIPSNSPSQTLKTLSLSIPSNNNFSRCKTLSHSFKTIASSFRKTPPQIVFPPQRKPANNCLNTTSFSFTYMLHSSSLTCQNQPW